MAEFEVQQTPVPEETKFNYRVGCLGCADQVIVTFEAVSLHPVVHELAEETGAPYRYDISSHLLLEIGISEGTCVLRGCALPPDSRRYSACPNSPKNIALADRLSEFNGIFVEKGTE